jgi:hypothetical protein
MAFVEYTNKEIAEYLEVAKEIGITRAKRQLGYPNSWGTAKRWVENAGIEVPLDEIKAQAAAHWDWYRAEDLLVVAKEALLRIIEALQSDALSPDDQKKLAEAYQKYVNTILLLEGKATSITESRKTDNMDTALIDLLNEEKARNARIESDVTNVEEVTNE